MPNILITGTPGTGKTSLSNALIDSNPSLHHIDLSQLISDQELHDGRDDHFDTLLINEDKVVDYLEDVLKIHSLRNFVVDFHGSDFFPERWFDLVIVLQTQTNVHYERLKKRYLNN